MKITKKQLKQIIKEEIQNTLDNKLLKEDMTQLKKYKDVLCDKRIQKAVLKVLEQPPGSITENMVMMMLKAAAGKQVALVEMLAEIAKQPDARKFRKELATFLNSKEAKPLIEAAFAMSKFLCQFDIPDIPGLPFGFE